MLKVVENVDIDLCIRTMLFEKLAKAVLKVISLCEFKNRLVNLLAEPYHRFSDELRSPFARTHEPRSYISDEQTRSVLVNI